MSSPGFDTRPERLPSTLPLFPLSGVLLLPRSRLPLNIFEPRYLNMVDDAIAGVGGKHRAFSGGDARDP